MEARRKGWAKAPLRFLGGMAILSFVMVAAEGAAVRGQATNPRQDKVQNQSREAAASIQGVLSTLDQDGKAAPLEGIDVELTDDSQKKAPLHATTDASGHYEFTGLSAGSYTLHVKQPGFKQFDRTVLVGAQQKVTLDIALNLESVEEKVEVKEQVPTVTPESSSPAATVSNEDLQALPLELPKFQDALPVVPGVIRNLDGKLSVRGASESQGMVEVDSAKTVDPVTGEFSIPVPIDAIQTVKVDKTPFAAENGGFSGGLTRIETAPPPTDWFFKVKDFNVSLRGKNGHFVGISQATPRVSFGGSLTKNITFTEVFEYDERRDPVRGLPWPRNEIKTEGFNSFTRAQIILSQHHVLNADVNVFPLRTQFSNITALIPQTASSDYDLKGVSGGLADIHTFDSGAALKLALRYTRFDSNAHGQGPENMLVTPDGWAGNFFSSWNRTANQYEFYPTYQFATWKWLGQHEIKIGGDLTHRAFYASNFSHPIDILRQDDSVAEQITFGGSGLQNVSITDVEEFVQDRWIINDQLALDLGGRLTSETVGRTAAFAPRLGAAYSPGKKKKTIFRVGTGIFYDRVMLLEAGFANNPERTVSLFDTTGQLIGTPISYMNAILGTGSGPIESRLRNEPNSSPRSWVSNFEVDRQLWSNAVLRFSYIYSETRNLFVVTPVQNVIANEGVLGLSPGGQSKYHEFETTLHFQPFRNSDLNISYIWSRNRGDLNTVSNLFLAVEQPIIRPNVTSVLPSDVPNRVVSWGVFHAPWNLTVSPVVDVHTGFPYSNVDVLQNYVGVPDSQRFPTFISFDGQVYRDFKFRLPFRESKTQHKVRLGVYSINLTNHHNFREVYNNETSPFFGQFAGFLRRVDGFILSFAD